jgi:hypothetical protein
VLNTPNNIYLFHTSQSHAFIITSSRTVSLDLLILLSSDSRGSGTVTMPTLGSIVQKGKLAAAALPFSTMALNSVDCRAARNADAGRHSDTSCLVKMRASAATEHQQLLLLLCVHPAPSVLLATQSRPLEA